MLVRQILKSKPETGVLSLAPGAKVSEAVAILSDKRVGTVVISSDDGETADGILSERDIVRELGRRGEGVLKDNVEALMTRKPVTCTEDDDAVDILQKMTDGRFRHLPVVRDGKLVGLVSIGDVVKARLAELAMEKDALEGMIMGH
ncbi:CBS domain-containing protein [Wenxinia marina]|uniref:Putative signal-transduction protein n=1 Tax=Wenxinia marina DSM 24838 TaxID=1123501 RepID=A0A0D0NNV5_9RHOB|nr:CBS domain-containing protein [Wenxinia marina]KIQ69970.1 putative signal-transduction protein [Wenxinia marina DSM 24838]GGL62523.1 inosine-5-monophosphate dehydrogenase [Wenxinia marina]